jgi:hypothetical protein
MSWVQPSRYPTLGDVAARPMQHQKVPLRQQQTQETKQEPGKNGRPSRRGIRLSPPEGLAPDDRRRWLAREWMRAARAQAAMAEGREPGKRGKPKRKPGSIG